MTSFAQFSYYDTAVKHYHLLKVFAAVHFYIKDTAVLEKNGLCP